MRLTYQHLGHVLLPFLLALASCSSPPHQADRELEDLIAAYRSQTDRSSERETRRRDQGVRAFQVERRADTGQWLVSAQLERAPLHTTVRRMLDETQTTYLVRAVLTGEVTARFERLPLRAALALLLETQGLSSWEQQGVLVIGDDAPAATPSKETAERIETPHALPPPAPLAPSSAAEEDNAAQASGAAPSRSAGQPDGYEPAGQPARVVSRAVQLRYLDVETVTTMFQALFPVDQASGAPSVRLAAQPFTSTVMLSGAKPAVARAARLLGELDRDPAHVLLEVLVVEFDTNELERLGMTLQDLQRGRFSGLAAQIGDATAPSSLSFTYTSGASAPLMFRAMIDVLSSQDKARVIARPYTAAMSGKKAVVQIARSRDIQQPVVGVDSSGTLSLPSPVTRETGVKLDVTPWVLADGRIRLELNVEESVFIDTLATNVIAETDKNTAGTTMMVESGQSIIIGGLTVRRKSSSNAGLPWLRHVPLLNLFTSQQASAEQKQDVIIYITPYIIQPGVDVPFPLPGAFKFRDGIDDLTEMESGPVDKAE
jgi:type IV pilus assembly protein PilQ